MAVWKDGWKALGDESRRLVAEQENGEKGDLSRVDRQSMKGELFPS